MASIQTSTNLTPTDLSLVTTNTSQYFNNFYSVPFVVSADANDAITAFFEQYCTNTSAAKSLASAVLYTALAQNLSPLTVLSEFESLPKGQLTAYLAAFLNVTRIPTSILGMNNGAATNANVLRSILL